MSKITFKANKNTVTANTYVAHELYKRNEAIVNELGGEILRGVGGFKAQFKTAANAKKFVEQAVTSISKREYNASRKTEPKAPAKAKAPASGKGKSAITIGNKQYTVKESKNGLMLVPVAKKATTTTKKATTTKKSAPNKGKGKSKMTEGQKRHKAYEMTNESFSRKVKYSTWKAKYEKILASL